MKRRYNRKQAGFTLVELLIVLVISGAIFAAVFGGLRFGARIWDVSHKKIEERSDVVLVQQLVRRLLSDMVPASELNQLDGQEVGNSPVIGNSTNLRLFSGYPRGLSNGLANEFMLHLDGKQLILDWWALDLMGEKKAEDQQHERRVLLDGVSSLSFRYLAYSSGSREWRSSWQGRGGIPDLVEMIIEFDDNQNVEWPTFMAEPKWRNETRFY